MKKLIFLLSLVFVMGTQLKAQTCGTCSVNITSTDTLNYTVNAGQNFCVAKNGNFSGNIILNGGTICVSGFFNPKSITVNSGTLNNYGTLSINNSITLGSGLTLTNNPGAIVNINGSITLNSATLSNSGIINVDQTLSNSGTVNNTSIINCTTVSGSGTLNDTGIINSN
ncbi:MAG: hypothetical protein SFY56_06840 [Bacteroidota bacterium]|nr:hypothetical protein [Bacteroidota bacterium]